MPEYQKQTVQWFPGHMARTRRTIKESLPLVDAVVELADARIPLSSRNPELDKLAAGKPRILILNKSDLADPNATAEWVRYFKAEGLPVLAADSHSTKGLQGFEPLVRDTLSEKIKSNERRGMAGRALRLMVVGIPNTGKSSLINRLTGKKRLAVADRPGVTKKNQWAAAGNGIELLDTPGVLWPKFDDPGVGDRLAFIGSVRDEVTDPETIAVRLLEVLLKDYSSRLAGRYKLSPEEQAGAAYEVLESIGRRRGMLLRGGEVDTERAANTLLDEYRSGLLGRITLERPPAQTPGQPGGNAPADEGK